MSRLRFATGAPKLTYRPGFCSLCGEAVSGRRKTWCSDACVEAWQLATDVGIQRRALMKRDRGVCVVCGDDTVALRAAFRCEMERVGNPWGHQALYARLARQYGDWTPPVVTYVIERRYPFARMTWWDADHIVPLVEGGAPGIENLRTLCNPCHKVETASLARRRAIARNPLSIPSFEPCGAAS